MKRSAIFCIFVLLAGLNSASSAQAIFGLSKCEKIKHQMLKAEKSLSDSLTYLSKFEGQEVTGSAYTVMNNFLSGDNVNLIWKIGYNNPECFTNTQKLRIQHFRPFVATDWLNFSPGKVERFTSGKCADTVARIVDESCVKNYHWIIVNVNKKYRSIYDF